MKLHFDPNLDYQLHAIAAEADKSLRREKFKNVMYRRSEKPGGEKTVDLLRATRPILIVDES